MSFIGIPNSVFANRISVGIDVATEGFHLCGQTGCFDAAGCRCAVLWMRVKNKMCVFDEGPFATRFVAYSLRAAQVTHLAHMCTSLVNPQRRESRWPLCDAADTLEFEATVTSQ